MEARDYYRGIVGHGIDQIFAGFGRFDAPGGLGRGVGYGVGRGRTGARTGRKGVGRGHGYRKSSYPCAEELVNKDGRSCCAA